MNDVQVVYILHILFPILYSISYLLSIFLYSLISLQSYLYSYLYNNLNHTNMLFLLILIHSFSISILLHISHLLINFSIYIILYLQKNYPNILSIHFYILILIFHHLLPILSLSSLLILLNSLISFYFPFQNKYSSLLIYIVISLDSHYVHKL